MKRRFLFAGLTLIPLTALALAIVASQTSLTSASYSDNVSRDVVSATPQTKFGIKEALVPSSPSAPVMKMTTLDIKQEPPRTPQAIDPADLAVGVPKIAYRYQYGFRLDPKALTPVQRAHADYCERQGPAICRIVSMEQSGEDGELTAGTLELAVATTRARSFGSDLSRQVTSAGGKEVASSISGEDLSKAIVDTEARLRARTLLRDRLMEVLASRKGTVAELVEAERGVAQVNEEIDEARSWLSEMKGRVAFSAVQINYASLGAPVYQGQGSGFWTPIRGVLSSLGAIFGTMIALIIAVAAIAVPLGMVGWAGRRAWLRWRPVQPIPAEA